MKEDPPHFIPGSSSDCHLAPVTLSGTCAHCGEFCINLPVNEPRKIITTHVYPPIPPRAFDWSAHYDGDEEGPHGWGSTEAEAIFDLKQNSPRP